MKTTIKILALIAMAAYLIFAMTTFNRTAAPKMCQGLDICIDDTAFLHNDDIRTLFVRENIFPEGQPLSTISLAKLESCLVASPYIDHALCYQTADAHIAIRITPRRPILHVLNSARQDFYIDNQGDIIPRGKHTANLITLTGNVQPATAGKLYTPLGLLLYQDPFWKDEIEEIHVTTNGEIHLTPHRGQHIIILGDTSQLQSKFTRLRIFYEQGLNKVGWNKYKTINLKFNNQIVCTKWE